MRRGCIARRVGVLSPSLNTVCSEKLPLWSCGRWWERLGRFAYRLFYIPAAGEYTGCTPGLLQMIKGTVSYGLKEVWYPKNAQIHTSIIVLLLVPLSIYEAQGYETYFHLSGFRSAKRAYCNQPNFQLPVHRLAKLMHRHDHIEAITTLIVAFSLFRQNFCCGVHVSVE